MRSIIAGIDVDRRLWRDPLRSPHVVPAPPQAVTLTPTPALPSAQHQHPKPKPDAVGESSSDPPSSGDAAIKARHGPILLPNVAPIKCSCSARAYNRGSSPSPSPICQNRGDHPHPGPVDSY